MFSTITTGAIFGMESYLVQVETDVSPGLPALSMVGSLAAEVREAGERVRVALRNNHIALPPQRITINLSPADRRKEGTAFDLPIAIGILTALGQIKGEAVESILMLGELGLDGECKAVRGVLPIVKKAAESGFTHVMLPQKNAGEAAVIEQITVIGIKSLKQALTILQNEAIDEFAVADGVLEINSKSSETDHFFPDFAEISGQEALKRGAMIAAAGFHHFLMIGPPGSGKTMVARRIPGILPPLSPAESLEVSMIYSISGLLNENQALIRQRPFLNPHHTVSEYALSGGGKIPRPGLISLAHRGVLFLDELTEFKKSALEILRQPLEEKRIQIARSSGNFCFPADFMMVAALNPCPCGYFPDYEQCKCTSYEVHRYLNKISGPILDRIDICMEASKVDVFKIHHKQKNISSQELKAQVLQARKLQEERYHDMKWRFNGELTQAGIQRYCPLGSREEKLMEQIYQHMKLSLRAYHRIIKVARTIADLAKEEHIREEHLTEAASYRGIDRKYWLA